jgi:hypothetical protein
VAFGIAAPVGALVVEEDPGADVVEVGRLDHPRADLRVAAHERPLALRERTALANQLVRDADPADVVQDAREPDPLDRLGRQPQLAGGELGEPADPVAVADASGVAHVEGLGEAEQRGEVHLCLLVPPRRTGEDAGHLGARDHGPVATQPLGGVQRLVGGSEERLGRFAVQREGRDTEGDADAVAGLDLGPDALGEHVGAVLVGARGEHGELLAADARGGVEAALG